MSSSSPDESAAPGSPVGADSALERRTIAKITRRLMPFLIALYFVNYLDRTNIGLAGPNGMNAELGLTASMFGFASGIFFIGYLLLEVPSNLALHKLGARRWLARIIGSWGLVAACIAFVPNAPWLYALRFLLGIAEAGFFPGVILYLTYWFPKRERARATAWFMVAIPLSSVFGAPVSGWLIQAGDAVVNGFAGWRFMYLIEGIPAIVLGVMCWFYLTDRPQQAKWLTDDERAWLVSEMNTEQASTAKQYHYPLRRAIGQPRIWALAFVYFGAVYGLYAMNFFLPTIIRSFEGAFGVTYSTFQVGLITAIPWAFGAIAMILWSRHGDRTQERVWHVAIPLFLGGAAIPTALYLNSPFMAMIAVTICCVSICCALPTFWPLPTTFLSGVAAAGGLALINSVGNSAGFLAPYITGWLREQTGSQNAGMWVIGTMMIASGFLVLILKAAPTPDDDNSGDAHRVAQ